MSARRRVVVTGLGVVSPYGIGLKVFEENIFAGRSGIRRITGFDPSGLPTKIAGEITDFDPTQFIDPKQARRMDQVHLFAVAAAKLALEDAKLDLEGMSEEEKLRSGIYIASGIGGIRTFLDQVVVVATVYFENRRAAVKKISPFFIPNIIANMPAGLVSMETGLMGPNFGPVSACASANHALGLAFREIRDGYADIMLTGGTESAVNFLGMAGFNAMRALSTRNDEPEKASRPFDRDRDGFVMGEGAGVLVFEELEHAKRRGAKIYAEVVGFGQSADAYHLTQPAPGGRGASLAISNALHDAGITPEQVDYINAHGTSTPQNDIAETQAIKLALGDHAYRTKISSTKSMIGHLLGAAAAVEAIATVLALVRQQCPPTINLENPDPECDLDYVPNQTEDHSITYAISNAFGFGGHNTVMVFKRWEGE